MAGEDALAYGALGGLKPVIDRTYPLDEIVDAHRYVEEGHKRGNVTVASVSPTETGVPGHPTSRRAT